MPTKVVEMVGFLNANCNASCSMLLPCAVHTPLIVQMLPAQDSPTCK
jgi:hypothetical protein